jgi:uncharacterized protein (TIGR02117 family)
MRWLLRSAALITLAILLFVAAAILLGNTPVNTDFQDAGAEGIEILVLNNGVHADLVLPIDNTRFRWLDHFMETDFRAMNSGHRYAIFGWGDRQFYMETRTWDDLKVSNVVKAFAGLGKTVVHVSLTEDLNWPKDRSRSIRITPDQFERLCRRLLETFERKESGALVLIPQAGYHEQDAFYEARGSYHLFRTCNVWAGDALAQAGVRVGFWTLTPQLLFRCLPAERAP